MVGLIPVRVDPPGLDLRGATTNPDGRGAEEIQLWHIVSVVIHQICLDTDVVRDFRRAANESPELERTGRDKSQDASRGLQLCSKYRLLP